MERNNQKNGLVNLAIALAKRIGEIVGALQLPWVLGMDANMDPTVFASNPDVAALGGMLVVPQGGHLPPPRRVGHPGLLPGRQEARALPPEGLRDRHLARASAQARLPGA
jgi:hypothetical protein